jgi:uncharacterized protein (DUF58 family)
VIKLNPEALGRRLGDIHIAWLIGGWLVATLGIALNRGVGLLWGMTWLLAAALIVAWLFPRWQVRGVTLRRSVPATAIAGEPTELRYELDVGRWPRYGLELRDRLGDDDTLVLAAYVERTRARDTVRLHWTPPVRGRRVLDAIVLESRFPLGVTVRRRTLACARQEVIVYPQAVALRRLPIERGSDSAVEHDAARERHGRDEYVGSRPYQPGDEPRSVHWRGTARSNTLVVREYDRTAQRQLWIFLELALGEHRLPGREGSFEMMFRIAHSALLRAQAEGVATGLVYRTRGRVEVVGATRDRATALHIREALALVDGDDGAPLATWLGRERQHLPRGGTWLVFAGDDAQRRTLTARCRTHGAVPLVVQFERASFSARTSTEPRPAPGARFTEHAWVAPASRGMDLVELF